MNLGEQLRGLIELAPHHIQRHFACDCAARMLDRAQEKNTALWDAIAVSRSCAEGKATFDELSEAWAAAWAVECGAARDVACAAARNSAQDAALSSASNATLGAAFNAVSDAMSGAAWNAAWAAALDKERTWQIEHLQSLIAAHNAARSSLLHNLQQRADSINPIFVQYARDLEERVFE